MKSESTGAKLNLSLAVTGKRGNMHTLDMRVCTADVCDRAELLPGEGERFVFRSFPEGFVPERFVPRLNAVYGKLRARFGGDFRFLIDKNIPSGMGLGGSSALAACMARLWAAEAGETPDAELLLSLGSDVPYMYLGGDARVTGAGECVEELPFTPRKVLVALPEGGVDTAAAYAEYDAMKARGDLPPREGEYFNDLYAPAAKLNPGTARAAAVLRAAGAENVVMTGSGSAVCAFFADGAERDRVRAAAEREVRFTVCDTLPKRR